MRNVLFILLALSGLACAITTKPTMTPAPSPTETLETNTTDTTLNMTQTYTASSTGCFAFDYPEDWELSGTGSDGVWVGQPAGGDGSSTNRIGFLPQTGDDIEALVLQVTDGGAIQDAVRADVMLASGLTGIRLTGKDGDADLILMFTVVGNRALAVYGYTDLITYGIVINTLRATC